jgi:hypothetical protein
MLDFFVLFLGFSLRFGAEKLMTQADAGRCTKMAPQITHFSASNFVFFCSLIYYIIDDGSGSSSKHKRAMRENLMQSISF